MTIEQNGRTPGDFGGHEESAPGLAAAVAPEFVGAADAVPSVTGHAEIDAALAGLSAVGDAPPAAQVPALTTAHQVLRGTLDAIGHADPAR